MKADHFRPRHEPARTIYDAFQAEAMNRKLYSIDEWLQNELNAVLSAAVKYAESNNLRSPTMAQVRAAELSASGHTDYGAKLAYAVASKMTPILRIEHATHIDRPGCEAR